MKQSNVKPKRDSHMAKYGCHCHRRHMVEFWESLKIFFGDKISAFWQQPRVFWTCKSLSSFDKQSVIYDVILRLLFLIMGPLIVFRRLFATFLDYPASTEFLIATNNEVISTGAWHGPDSLKWLYRMAPCFPISGNQISIINEPKEFYNILLEKCSLAKRRIVLSSLYLGTGHLETAFVQAVLKNVKENGDLKVNILLDFARGTRGEKNSKTLLMPLVKESENCLVSLYHTPLLRGITKRLAPPRYNELIGLQHMKIYVFDNSVIISGANLSNDYFTNRQDRYALIEDKPLADFYSGLVSVVQRFSLCVNKSSELELHKNWQVSPYEGTKGEFITEAKEHVRKYFDNVTEAQKLAVAQNIDADTWVFPSIEMGQLGIHHDSLITKKLFSSSIEGSVLKLATGYFNLTQEYMNTITNDCLARCSILMAHPSANGFQGAKGPAGGIPAAYTLIAKHFYEALVKANQSHRVKFYEYERKGWTYHAKGLWYYLPGSDLPNLTLIGSSNFGERSVNRDLESQICVITTNNSLQKQLQNEVDLLYKQGSTAEAEITSRPVPRWVKAVVKIFRNFF